MLTRAFKINLILFVIVMTFMTAMHGCSKMETEPAVGEDKSQLPPVRAVLWTVEATDYIETERFVGSMTPKEFVEIKSEVPGVIEAVHFEEGQSVSTGDVLVELDKTKLVAQLEQVKADLDQNKIDFEVNSQLFKQKAVSEQEYNRSEALLKSSQALFELRSRQLQDATLVAPFSGTVGERNFSIGQLISPQNIVTHLVALDPIDLEFQLPEKFLNKVSIGQNVEVQVRSWPEESFRGRVHFIAPYVDPNTRTVTVKAVLDNEGHKLKPGMFCKIFLEVDKVQGAFLIPESAIFRVINQKQASVFKVNSENKCEMVMIEMGKRLPGMIRVTDGVSEGDRVLVEGIQKAIPGANVIPAPEESKAPYNELFNAVKSSGNK